MNEQQLKDLIVSTIDAVLSAPIARRFVSNEQKRMFQAQRNYWMQDDGTQLSKLLGMYDAEPFRELPEEGIPTHPLPWSRVEDNHNDYIDEVILDANCVTVAYVVQSGAAERIVSSVNKQ